MPYQSQDRQRAAQRESYARNKDKYQARSRGRYWRRKAWIEKLFEGVRCIHCAEDFRPCIDLHHLDPNAKEASIAQMYRNGSSPERVVAEIEKCVPLCSNCHRKLHYGALVIENIEQHLIKVPHHMLVELREATSTRSSS